MVSNHHPGLNVATPHINLRLGYLAAGNVHFSCPATVIELDRPFAPVSENTFQTLIRQANHLIHPYPTPLVPDLPQVQAPVQWVEQIACMAVELQRRVALQLPIENTVRRPNDRPHRAALVCLDRATGHAATTWALHLLVHGVDTQSAQHLKTLQNAARPWVGTLALAAQRRDIPVSLVGDAGQRFFALGQGHKRRLFWRHFTPQTSHIATELSTRKDLTARLLRSAGLPAPLNRVVPHIDAALAAAESLTYPVVVKPVAADYGNGVTTGIKNSTQLRSAYPLAAAHGTVLIEQQIPGEHHRLLVMHGQCIAVSRRWPAHVMGDGQSTLVELLIQINRHRTPHLSAAGVRIELDDAARALLKDQGLTEESVPEKDRRVFLRTNSNQSSGGTVEMVTEIAHPDVLKLGVQAAALLGIDVAGIDYITTDISQSPSVSGGAICEVNVTPGFVNQGASEALYQEFFQPFFGADQGRIPTLCLLSSAELNPSSTLPLAALFEGQVVHTHQIRMWGQTSAPPLPQRVSASLADPFAAAVIITCNTTEFHAQGLGINRCTLAILDEDAEPALISAMLRIASTVVLHANACDNLDPESRLQSHRIWVIGQPASSSTTEYAGLVYPRSETLYEVAPHMGSKSQVSIPHSSAMDIIALACAAALGRPFSAYTP